MGCLYEPGETDSDAHLQVYVVSLSQSIPSEESVMYRSTGWATRNLKPMQLVRQSAVCVYAGEEFNNGDYYHREWAVLTKWSLTNLQQCLDRELFSVRKVISPETFLAKYEDLVLHLDHVDVFKIGTL